MALMTTGTRRRRRSAGPGRPHQRSNAAARSAERDEIATAAPQRAAAIAAARAPPPVPTMSQGPGGGASGSRARSSPSTSVLPPTTAPSSLQNTLHASTSVASSSLTVHRQRRGLLVRDGDVAAPAGSGEGLKQRGDIGGCAAEGDVHRPEAEGPEGGVLHGRGE